MLKFLELYYLNELIYETLLLVMAMRAQDEQFFVL